MALQHDHVVTPISKPAETLKFYRDVLGLPLAEAYEGDDWGGYPWLMLIFVLSDGRELVFVSFKGAPPTPPHALAKDARHIALAETGSLDSWREKLRAAGVAFWEEDHGKQQSLYFEDPNGLVIEITSPPSALGAKENAAAVKRAERWIGSAGA